MIGWIVLAVMVGAIIGWIFCSFATNSRVAELEAIIERLRNKKKKV